MSDVSAFDQARIGNPTELNEFPTAFGLPLATHPDFQHYRDELAKAIGMEVVANPTIRYLLKQAEIMALQACQTTALKDADSPEFRQAQVDYRAALRIGGWLVEMLKEYRRQSEEDDDEPLTPHTD